jgi:hypothetical protein
MDKRPWSQISPPVGPVEAEFLRRVLLGENLAPHRLLGSVLAVIPAEKGRVLDAQNATEAGHRHLAGWLRDAESKWATEASRSTDGELRMTLQERLDHMRGLSQQLGITGPRVVYTKAGTRLSAALLEDPSVIVDHMAYWASSRSLAEAHYLCLIINSDTALQRIIPMQPRGWRDPRHFDKLVWELPVPEFDESSPLHQDIATAGAAAQARAAEVPLPEGDFRRKRRAIREALVSTGLAARMEGLVVRLLDG